MPALKANTPQGREKKKRANETRGETEPAAHCAACVFHSALWPLSQLL